MPFLGYLPVRIPLFGVPEVSAFFTGILELCILSKEGSNALLTNPCPEITAHFLTAARPGSGSFVVRNGPRDIANSYEHCT